MKEIQTKRMLLILDFGGTIEASGHIFAMTALIESKTLSWKYQRKRMRFHNIIHKMSNQRWRNQCKMRLKQQ